MSTYDPQEIDPAEITPEHVYRNRRSFIAQMAREMGRIALPAGALALVACGVEAGTSGTGSTGGDAALAEEDKPNTFEAITNYNNYYEFSTDKEGVARMVRSFKPEPWSLEVGGLVTKPKTYALADLQRFPQEDRVYRLRCVEGWSMVIPWRGFPLKKMLEEVEPTGKAKFVRFQTVLRPDEMPGQKDRYYPWPYTEGLRLDEAMHDLALMVTGLYGKPLPAQNGAPIRLTVPWKYGFKGVKAIVKMDLVDTPPTTLWMAAAPEEYGFYANVNPDVPHPRWSQATERRIGEIKRRKTLFLNGYADLAGKLYQGMDLRRNF